MLGKNKKARMKPPYVGCYNSSSWLGRPLAIALFVVPHCAFADSYWQGGTGGFNVPGSWNPVGVPTSVNAINDSGSNNVVLIRLGDPVWRPWDIRAGDGANLGRHSKPLMFPAMVLRD
jgi:hypothetical protein